MKKKYAALFLSFALLLMLVPTASARTLTFVAINNNFSRNISPSTMPARINGNMYLPYTFFRNIGGLKTLYNSRYDQIIIYNGSHILTFDISNQLTYDELGSVYSANAVRYNGTIFIPARTVCECFSFEYSYITTSGLGPVLRIVTDDSALSDDALMERELTTMRNIYNDYQKLYGESSPGTPGTTVQKPTSESPSTPSSPESPADPETPTNSQEDPQPSKAVYLAFAGPLSDATASILDQLSAQGYQATFFVPSGIDAVSAPYLVRAAAEGHTIGNYLNGAAKDADTSAELVSQAAETNTQLRQLLKQRARLLMVPGGSSTLTAEETEALLSAGYRLWDPSVNLKTGSGAAMASSALRQLRNTSQNVVLCLQNNAAGAEALHQITNYLKAQNYDVRPITEINTPINELREVR